MIRASVMLGRTFCMSIIIKIRRSWSDKSGRTIFIFMISVKTGEEHKLDVLSNANQVVHWTQTNTKCREVWSRSSGAQSDQLTDTDGTLTIKEFTANDAGTYRVLDRDGDILITVTVAESSTESEDKLNDTDTHKTDDAEPHTGFLLLD